MRTLIASDLHLGTISGIDLARRAELRAPLIEAAAQADRVVLLGDVLELRQGPPREALAAARPFFEDLGAALAGRELVIVAGNHDHAMVEPWLAHRALDAQPSGLDLSEPIQPEAGSELLRRIASWAAPARVSAAYPGIWIRGDTYATHGHYLDCHLTVPTLERLSIAAMSRVLRQSPSSFATVDDYEALTAPVYAWRDAAARDAKTSAILNGVATVDVWSALRRGGGGRGAGARRRSGRDAGGVGAGLRAARSSSDGLGAGLEAELRKRALATAFPLAVAALNRAGFGPLRADISVAQLRRAGLAAMAEVTRRLEVDASYVIFGHTHRAGPLPSDRELEWRAPVGTSRDGRGGIRLINSGCWVYARVFLTDTPGESPYWPGTCVLVEDDGGPPQLTRLLARRTHAELMPAAA